MTWDGQSNDRTGVKTSPYVQYAIQDDVLLPCKETEHAWPNLHTFADNSVIDPEEDFYLPGPLLARQVERLLAGDEAPEFWGFGGLDASRGWTALCSLWGAAGLPAHFPRRWWDLEQLCLLCGWDPSVLVRERFGEEATRRHNALEDARWIRRLHISVTDLVKERGLRGIAGALRQRLVDDRSLRRKR